VISEKIRKIPGIHETKTYHCMKPDAFLKPKEHL
jgi:hypothetical protein